MRVPLGPLLLFLLLTLALAALGAGVGYLLHEPGWWALCTVLLVLPILLFFQKHCWGRLAFSIFAGLAIIAANLHGFWAGLATYAAALVGITAASASLGGLYGGSAWKALGQHLKVMLHIKEGFHIVDGDGSFGARDAEDEWFLGPRTVIVRPGYAATLVNGGKRTRVMGPSLFESERFEHVRSVYALTPLRRELQLCDVLTTDLIALKVDLSVTYGLDNPAAMRSGVEPLSDDARQLLEHIDDDTPGWDRQCQAIIEGDLRRVMGEIKLWGRPGETADIEKGDRHELLDIAKLDREEIERKLMVRSGCRLSHLGVRLLDVTIVNMHPQAEVLAANSQAAIAAFRERGQAEAWRDAMTALADGYKIAASAQVTPQELYAITLRRVLELYAQSPAVNQVMSVEALHALEELRQMLNGAKLPDGPATA